MNKSIKQWDLILPQIQFAYDRSISQYIDRTHFEIIYDWTCLHVPILLIIELNTNIDIRVKEIWELREKVKKEIVIHNSKYQKQANKSKKTMNL